MAQRKELSTESSSLETFAHHSEHTEITKKAISSEEISVESVDSIMDRETYHSQMILPFETDTKALIKHLHIKFEEMGSTILHCDEELGELLLKQATHDSCLSRCLDCLCLLRREGCPGKNIQKTFETVSITIKRENIEHKCTLTIRTNLPKHKASKELIDFAVTLAQHAREILSSFKVKDYSYGIREAQVRYDSPLYQEILTTNKIHSIFVSGSWEDKRNHKLFQSCVEKLQLFTREYEEMEKVNVNKLHKLVEQVILETNALFSALAFTQEFKKMALHKDYTLYSLENLLCYHYFSSIYATYKRSLSNNCEVFRKNSQHINKHLSIQQYFDYLEVRPKYRLVKQAQPYGVAIEALRQLETAVTLRDCLLCVQKTFSLVKVCCLEEHNGKVEISSMDDILPVMIYVAAKAQVDCFPVYVQIVDDYIRIRDTFELEERVVTTLHVAVEDIIKKIPHP